jgi:hypothetical protein
MAKYPPPSGLAFYSSSIATTDIEVYKFLLKDDAGKYMSPYLGYHYKPNIIQPVVELQLFTDFSGYCSYAHIGSMCAEVGLYIVLEENGLGRKHPDIVAESIVFAKFIIPKNAKFYKSDCITHYNILISESIILKQVYEPDGEWKISRSIVNQIKEIITQRPPTGLAKLSTTWAVQKASFRLPASMKDRPPLSI